MNVSFRWRLDAGMKEKIISAGLRFFRATGLHRPASRLTQGMGAILMFHNVRPFHGGAYAPNLPLEVTPDFFELTLTILREKGYEIVPIGDLPHRLAASGGRRFAAITFDDGYRDNIEIAAPILRRHNAPYTIYVTTGFAERTARLWWLELEAAIGGLDLVEIRARGGAFSARSRTAEEKHRAFGRAYSFLRQLDEPAMLDCVSRLLEQAGLAPRFAELCMTWDEIRAAGDDPLCTIGVHTLTHARLTKHDEAFVRRELQGSRELIESRTGRKADHLAYPFGDPGSAGRREFEIARECGFSTAVTTRPGVLFASHAAHMTALPRLAVQGGWQDGATFETLLSGAPFALWNLGRRVNAG